MSADIGLASSARFICDPDLHGSYLGFRVASVPEPATILLLGLGGLLLRSRKKLSSRKVPRWDSKQRIPQGKLMHPRVWPFRRTLNNLRIKLRDVNPLSD